MTPNIKTAVLISGFALLAILAVAGWTRKPSAADVGPSNFASPSGVYTAANPTDPNRATYGQPAYGRTGLRRTGGIRCLCSGLGELR